MASRNLAIVVIVAGCAATLGAVAGWHLAAPPPGPADEEYLVAVSDMNFGDEIHDIDRQFRTEKLVVGTAPPDAFLASEIRTNPEQFRGQRLSRRLSRGDIFALAHLKAAPIATNLPAGLRAVAVPVHLDTKPTDTPLPGNRIDLIFDGNKTKPDRGRLVQDVLLLATKSTPTEPPGPDAPVGNAVLIVAVKPRDAERITWAIGQHGVISPLLRKPDDHTIYKDSPIPVLDPDPAKQPPPNDKK